MSLKKPMNEKEVENFVIEILKSRMVDPYHDIPYLAGYNKSGTKIYIDKDIPFFYKGYPIYELLLIHEHVEKIEIDLGIHYQTAHLKALTIEKMACTAIGLQWNEYNAYMQKQIKTSEHKRLENVPGDLDLTPYIDEHDYTELKRIISSKGGL